MDQIIRIGMDTSKYIFQLHGVDGSERVVLRRTLRRNQVLAFFAKLPPTVVGMEACGAAHYWARKLRKLGHEVKLMAPQHVKAYVKRNKNDGRDAEGLCEAMSRPTMQFVPVKSEEQQVALMLAGVREQLIARRTQLCNAIRGYAAEFWPDRGQGSRQDRAAIGADRARQHAACDDARAVGFAGKGLRAVANRAEGG
jgi:transposase